LPVDLFEVCPELQQYPGTPAGGYAHLKCLRKQGIGFRWSDYEVEYLATRYGWSAVEYRERRAVWDPELRVSHHFGPDGHRMQVPRNKVEGIGIEDSNHPQWLGYLEFEHSLFLDTEALAGTRPRFLSEIHRDGFYPLLDVVDALDLKEQIFDKKKLLDEARVKTMEPPSRTCFMVAYKASFDCIDTELSSLASMPKRSLEEYLRAEPAALSRIRKRATVTEADDVLLTFLLQYEPLEGLATAFPRVPPSKSKIRSLSFHYGYEEWTLDSELHTVTVMDPRSGLPRKQMRSDQFLKTLLRALAASTKPGPVSRLDKAKEPLPVPQPDSTYPEFRWPPGEIPCPIYLKQRPEPLDHQSGDVLLEFIAHFKPAPGLDESWYSLPPGVKGSLRFTRFVGFTFDERRWQLDCQEHQVKELSGAANPEVHRSDHFLKRMVRVLSGRDYSHLLQAPPSKPEPAPRPPRPERTVIFSQIEEGILAFAAGFWAWHDHGVAPQIRFQRTLVNPGGGWGAIFTRLGRPPLRKASDFPDRVPPDWLKGEGECYFLPLYQQEALWMDFRTEFWAGFAVRIKHNDLNSLTGKEWEPDLKKGGQDDLNYLVTPVEVALRLDQQGEDHQFSRGNKEWERLEIFITPPQSPIGAPSPPPPPPPPPPPLEEPLVQVSRTDREFLDFLLEKGHLSLERERELLATRGVLLSQLLQKELGRELYLKAELEWSCRNGSQSFVNLAERDIPAELFSLVPEDLAISYFAVPFDLVDGVLYIASCSNSLEAEMAEKLGRRIKVFQATEADLRIPLNRHYDVARYRGEFKQEPYSSRSLPEPGGAGTFPG
jgi:hypothetical protein